MRRTATLALWLVVGLLAAVAPPATAAPVVVTPDVTDLPAGALPKLPYVNWSTKRIVDGSRQVSIAGIKARVISLLKVDGGYLLGRRLSVGNDLVFVSTKGVRRVLVEGWRPPPYGDFLGPGLAVSHHGDKVLVNTRKFVGEERQYVDTRVLSLPGGKVLRRRDFGIREPFMHAFGVDRALMTFSSTEAHPFPDVRWWNPASNAVTPLRADASTESVDLTAWQWAVTPYAGVDGYSVQGLPPDTSPHWDIGAGVESIGPWSPDDTKVVGIDEVTDDLGQTAAQVVVFDTADGTVLLDIRGTFPPQVTWESDSTLLIRTQQEGPASRRFQLIRCTLAGVCQRVGQSTPDREGTIIPAFRRNS